MFSEEGAEHQAPCTEVPVDRGAFLHGKVRSVLIPASKPRISGLAPSLIEARAEGLTRSGGYPTLACERLLSIVYNLGGHIDHAPVSHPMLLVADAPQVFAITRLDAWQMAIALGHLTLHFDGTSTETMAVPAAVTANDPWAHARVEATVFAKALLMPRAELLAALDAGDLRSAAAKFGLPLAIVASRIRAIDARRR